MARMFGRADDFTATTSGVTVPADGAALLGFSLSVNETGGTATSWTVVLETSLDGVNFTTVVTHSRTDGVGTQKWPADAIPRPANFIRARCTAIVIGTATKITATFTAFAA